MKATNIKRSGNNDHISSSLPMPIRVRPYMHQQAAFDFTCEKFGLVPGKEKSPGVALLMEMGCGKTLTAIGISGILYQFGLAERALVVAPLSILGVWEEEFSSFAAFPYSLTILKGTSEKKRKQIQGMSGRGLQVLVDTSSILLALKMRA